MTKRFLTTTTAAITMVLAGAIGAQANNDASVKEQAAEAVDAIGDTAYAIGETATDTAQAGVEAVGADEAYSEASDISAQLDAALTDDAIVRSSDGEIIGTVLKSDTNQGLVVIDLDGEMEGADERPIENAAVRMSRLSANADQDLVLNMSKAEFASALNAATEVNVSTDG
ncbi:hypothetical protein AYJ57_18385 [Salipiger sp. CCB-MM3]|uniref:hypothetical protein n=1 Tax=Salipiger sp. CCB-MM3 TaxID=1792508 RepID=UPI00080AC100|nr:hypothetical protein [Salipiger sp. CCB-MM3]ANT62380.1 hypothetical protein AYJ57_18385 [Salipiger sp. CCB-MM3]